MWFLNIPPFKAGGAGGEKRPAGEGVSAISNLTAGKMQPTIMEEWLITAIRVPVAVIVEAGEPKALENAMVKVTLKLRIGGDLVWAAEQEQSQLSGVKGSGGLIETANFLFGESFPIPIGYMRGRQIQLEVSVVATVELERLEALVSQTANTSNILPATVAGDEGSLQYDIRVMSGHRTL